MNEINDINEKIDDSNRITHIFIAHYSMFKKDIAFCTLMITDQFREYFIYKFTKSKHGLYY